jgi:hypothetical protein
LAALPVLHFLGSTSKTFYADASQKDRSKLLQRRGDF